MIRVSVLYPAAEGAEFDLGYYVTSHIPMVREQLGDALRGLSVERGVSDAVGGAAPFVAIAHMDFESTEAYERAMGPVAGDVMRDLKNYTSIRPVMLISEIVEA